jgi:phosphatidate cytidylyltransferase
VSAPDHRERKTAGDLKLRIASSVVLAPVVLGVTVVGGWPFVALCALAAGGIFWEWSRLVAPHAAPGILTTGGAGLAAAATFVALAMPAVAIGAVGIGTFLTGVVAAFGYPGRRMRGSLGSAAWAAAGVLYAGTILICPTFLRRDPERGLTALLFLFATVWMTDTFAFFCGRAIGGPKLLPQVSPNKTWSGAIGGLIGGLAAGVAVAYASGVGRLGIIGAMGFLLSGIAQAGDLFESAVKRRFGAKDAGHLIPGHGGLMDRLDGLLFAVAAALLIGAFRQGTAAPARGLLVW